MAYMVAQGIADFAISEDSDLIVFGCPRILFKLDPAGVGQLYDHALLKECKDATVKQLFEFPSNEFAHLIAMAGCDYLDSLPGVGLRSALKLFVEHCSLDKVLEFLTNQKNRELPENYKSEVEQVGLLFNH